MNGRALRRRLADVGCAAKICPNFHLFESDIVGSPAWSAWPNTCPIDCFMKTMHWVSMRRWTLLGAYMSEERGIRRLFRGGITILVIADEQSL